MKMPGCEVEIDGQVCGQPAISGHLPDGRRLCLDCAQVLLMLKVGQPPLPKSQDKCGRIGCYTLGRAPSGFCFAHHADLITRLARMHTNGGVTG